MSADDETTEPAAPAKRPKAAKPTYETGGWDAAFTLNTRRKCEDAPANGMWCTDEGSSGSFKTDCHARCTELAPMFSTGGWYSGGRGKHVDCNAISEHRWCHDTKQNLHEAGTFLKNCSVQCSKLKPKFQGGGWGGLDSTKYYYCDLAGEPQGPGLPGSGYLGDYKKAWCSNASANLTNAGTFLEHCGATYCQGVNRHAPPRHS